MRIDREKRWLVKQADTLADDVDILRRLRFAAPGQGSAIERLLTDAADEIEKLRRKIDENH